MLLDFLSKQKIIKINNPTFSNQNKILICPFNSQIKKLSEILPYFKKIVFINNDLENQYSLSESNFDKENVFFYSDQDFFNSDTIKKENIDNNIFFQQFNDEIFLNDSDDIIILLDSVLYKFGRNERKIIFESCKIMLNNFNSSKGNKLIVFEPIKENGSSNTYSSIGYYSLLKDIDKYYKTKNKTIYNQEEKLQTDDNKVILNPATVTNLLETLDFQIEQRDVILKERILKEQNDKDFNCNYLEQTKKRLLTIVSNDKRTVDRFFSRITETMDNLISYEKSLKYYSWFPFLTVVASFKSNDNIEEISDSYKKITKDTNSTNLDFITPREKLLTGDTEQLSLQELVSVIIGMGSKSEDVYTLSNRIIREYGSKALAEEKNPKKLQEALSIGEVNACKIVATFELGRRFYSNKILNRKLIRGPEDVFEYAQDMSTLVKENFRGLYLNSKNYIIHDEVISIGHLTASLVHPREVFKSAIEYSAAGIIVLHNHPSGDPEPSVNDKKITKTLVETGKILNIPVLDHIIIGEDKYYSFNDNGEL